MSEAIAHIRPVYEADKKVRMTKGLGPTENTLFVCIRQQFCAIYINFLLTYCCKPQYSEIILTLHQIDYFIECLHDEANRKQMY